MTVDVSGLRYTRPPGAFAVDGITYLIGTCQRPAAMFHILDDLADPVSPVSTMRFSDPPSETLLDRWVREGRAPGIDQLSFIHRGDPT